MIENELMALPKEDFTHRVHLKTAWACLRGVPFEDGAPRFVRLLRAYTAKHGVEAKFHATITWAFLALVAERAARTPALGFDAFLTAHPELNDPKLIASRYAPGVLDGPQARAVFVLPGSLRASSARAASGRAPPGRAAAARRS